MGHFPPIFIHFIDESLIFDSSTMKIVAALMLIYLEEEQLKNICFYILLLIQFIHLIDLFDNNNLG